MLTSCVTLGKTPYLSEPHFSHLQNRDRTAPSRESKGNADRPLAQHLAELTQDACARVCVWCGVGGGVRGGAPISIVMAGRDILFEVGHGWLLFNF